MLTFTYALLFLAGFFPWLKAWQANRSTSMSHAVLWGILAWLSWGLALFSGGAESQGFETYRFISLNLTAAAGVAVLGARRPHVMAWNFVVLGLLSVMLLPLAEHLVLGTSPTSPLRIVFLGSTLAVVLVNYLPTGQGVAAIVLGLGCLGEMVSLFGATWFGTYDFLKFAHLFILASPFFAGSVSSKPNTAFNARWLAFRDRLGLLWALRVREQFNQAAGHASCSVTLGWSGIDSIERSGSSEPKLLELLDAVLRRFMPISNEANTEEQVVP